ncbi:barstar family protein [Kerstersia sp.]|uniref:barstar family protein n=1 Tax=Kerstersia sp. TaxID=1930783 RepID=UPI003F8E80C4
MSSTPSNGLAQALQRGGAIDLGQADAAGLEAAASAQGLGFFIADCDRARSRSAVLRAIAKAVDFPVFFGNDMDSLYDCLTDTVQEQRQGVLLYLRRLHSGDPALEGDAREIQTVCENVAEAVADTGKVFAFVIEHAGRHPDPEPGLAQSWSAQASGDEE